MHIINSIKYISSKDKKQKRQKKKINIKVSNHA